MRIIVGSVWGWEKIVMGVRRSSIWGVQRLICFMSGRSTGSKRDSCNYPSSWISYCLIQLTGIELIYGEGSSVGVVGQRSVGV